MVARPSALVCKILLVSLVLVCTFVENSKAQTDGPASVQSNGVSISFSNAGPDAHGSNGVSISFQNAGNAESGTSSGVSIGFGDPIDAAYYHGRNPNAGYVADPVNTATGNFTFDKTDLTVAARGFPFEFKRFYNSQDPTPGPMGVGWTHSYNLSLTEDPTDNSVSVRLEDGHTEVYLENGGTYTPKYPGMYSELTKNPDNTFTIKEKNQRKLNFRSDGKLSAIVDRNDNTATLNYDPGDRLESVDVPGGRSVTFSYDSNDRLTSVTDTLTPTPRVVIYTYDGNDNLESVTDPNGNTTQFTYDNDHQLLTATDPRGNVFVTNTYDPQNRVVTFQTDAKGNPTSFEYFPDEGRTKITDAQGNFSYDYHDFRKRMIKREDNLGRNYSYSYDDNNNRLTVTDKNSNTTKYEYDTNGNVTKQEDPYGRTITITYNTLNSPLSRNDEAGRITTFEYDTNGNLTKSTEPQGMETLFTYDATGQLLTVTDALGRVTANTYSAAGDLATITDAAGGVTTYGYDSIGRRVSTTDARSKTTTFAYDGNGNLLSVTDPLGGTTSNEYDGNDSRTKVTDARGGITVFEFDQNNLLTKVTDAMGGITEHTYDSLNRRVSTKDQRGFITTFVYDLEGRLKKVTDPNGNATQFEYDFEGNRTKAIDPKGNERTFEYDRLNRLIRTTDPLGNQTTRSYDEIGRLRTTVDGNGNPTELLYDDLDRLTKVIEANGKETIYTYDLVGNRLSIKNQNKQITSLTYDSLNRLTSRTNPLNKTYSFEYDAVGNVTRRTDANGNVTDYTYDDNNRRAGISYPDSSSVSLVYDLNGNLTQMTDSSGVTSFVYDNLNRITSYTDSFGNTLGYEYDPASNRTALVYPDGKRVEYQFDPGGRLAQASDWGSRITSYTYDQASLLTGILNSNGTASSFGYDPAGRVTSMANAKSDQSLISDYLITLDGVGNRTNISGTDPLTTGVEAADTSYTFNEANQILSDGPTTFSSDDNGNLKTQTSGTIARNFVYDFEDRLISGSDGTDSATSTYNGAGIRLSKTENGETVRFVIDPTGRIPRIVAETDSGGTITAYYTRGLGLISKITPANEAYQYHFDIRGSTVAISDENEQLVNRYAYGPFGEEIATSEQIENRFQYLGQYGVTKEPFDLLFASRRYYNPNLGRFLTKDEAIPDYASPQTLNEYIYSLNNPISLIDPTGLAGERDGGSALGAQGSSDVDNNGTLNCGGSISCLLGRLGTLLDLADIYARYKGSSWVGQVGDVVTPVEKTVRAIEITEDLSDEDYIVNEADKLYDSGKTFKLDDLAAGSYGSGKRWSDLTRQEKKMLANPQTAPNGITIQIQLGGVAPSGFLFRLFTLEWFSR